MIETFDEKNPPSVEARDRSEFHKKILLNTRPEFLAEKDSNTRQKTVVEWNINGCSNDVNEFKYCGNLGLTAILSYQYNTPKQNPYTDRFIWIFLQIEIWKVKLWWKELHRIEKNFDSREFAVLISFLSDFDISRYRKFYAICDDVISWINIRKLLFQFLMDVNQLIVGAVTEFEHRGNQKQDFSAKTGCPVRISIHGKQTMSFESVPLLVQNY